MLSQVRDTVGLDSGGDREGERGGNQTESRRVFEVGSLGLGERLNGAWEVSRGFKAESRVPCMSNVEDCL